MERADRGLGRGLVGDRSAVDLPDMKGIPMTKAADYLFFAVLIFLVLVVLPFLAAPYVDMQP